MDSSTRQLIVPVMATRFTRLADGQPVRQAVPEDYTLAAILINALGEKNDNNIEFALKTYLPIRVVPSTLSSGCFLIEYQGMSSTNLVSHQETDFGDLLERVRSSHSTSELLDCISDCLSLVDTLSGAISQEHLGVLSGPLAAGVSQMLEWPTKERLEEYALILPKMLKDSDVEKCAEALQETFRVLRNTGVTLTHVNKEIALQMKIIVSEKESQTSTIVTRLNQRIDVLRKEVANLESRIEQMTARDSSARKRNSKKKEIETTLKGRKKALERDIARREEILAGNQDAFRDLLMQQKELHSRTKSARSGIENQRRLMREAFLVTCSGVGPDKEGVVLMIPFIMVGFSKKGRLRVVVYAPSYLQRIDQQVGRRRDYVHPLTADPGLNSITSELTRRANGDVGFRNYLRTSSKKNNLLTIGVARSLIREGGKSLQSDGLVKMNLLDEISSIISGFPESKRKPMKLSKVSTLPSGTDATCFVRFHVRDDSGKPIEGALLELGAFLLQSDTAGVIGVSLPKSRYEGVIRANDYHDKPIEFTLSSTGNLVIPVTLDPFSDEERLTIKFDKLMKRAQHIDEIRDRLRDAFQKQGSTLLSIPAYRSAFEELLTELGYEPESWIAEATKKKGMVKRLLKRDDRLEGLRRDILRLAQESKESGGIMMFSEFLVRLDSLGWATKSKEIENIVTSMTKEGLIQGMARLENGTRLVKFIPVELTRDPTQVLGLAAKKDGRLTIEDVVVGLGWTEDRVTNALDLLAENGVAKVQKSYSKSTIYWFPGFRGRRKK
ncbi:MAG: hypothetical protein RTU09_08275 [Candidatus Thorarchaeota archaeon]